MHGDFAPIKEISGLSRLFNCYVMFDDAHGFMLDHELCEIPRNNLIVMGTCSKALGSYGGYISASKNICNFLMSDARSLIYSTALPKVVIEGTLSVISELLSKSEEYQSKLQSNVEFFEQYFGIINEGSPIKIIEFDSIDDLESKYMLLYDSGFWFRKFVLQQLKLLELEFQFLVIIQKI